jgi:hypothetical protein
MDLFQQIVITVAILFLIIFLIYIAYMMHLNKVRLAYPPVTGSCPDYWIDQSTGIEDSSNCINAKNLGKSSASCPKNMNFNTALFSGSTGLCAKSVWSKNCDLTWDGVTNNVNACSDTSSIF